MLKQLIKFSASYTAIEGFQKGILFLLLPIITSYMSTEEYGIVSTVLMIISFLSILFSFAIESGISRYYHAYVKDNNHLKLFLGSNFIALTILAFSVCIILILFGKPVFGYFFGEIAFKPYVIYALIIIASQVLLNSYFALLKAAQSLKQYFYLYSSYFLLQTILMLVLVVNFNLKQDGYLLSILANNLLFLIVVFFLLLPKISFRIELKYIKETFQYSIPIVPVNIMGEVGRLIDRYYILTFIGLSSVGIYYVGVQIAGVINLIAMAINSAYTPIFFKKYENDKNGNYNDIYHLADLIVFSMGIITALFSILYPYFLNLFSKEYLDAHVIILFLLFSGAMTSIYFINTNVLFLNSKLIKFRLYGVMVGTVINLSLGYILTKKYGIEGAAFSTMFAYIIMTFILIWIVRKKSHFRFNNIKYLLYYFLLFYLIYTMDTWSILNKSIILSLYIFVFFIVFFKIARLRQP